MTRKIVSPSMPPVPKPPSDASPLAVSLVGVASVPVWDAAMTAKLLKGYRLPCSSEKELQDAIERVFIAAGVPHEREKILDRKNVVDFLVGDGVALECKIHAPVGAVFRQVQRYAAFPEVREILLVTSKHMGLPKLVEGKAALVFKVGLTWL